MSHPTPKPTFVSPNLFQLSGEGLQILYTTSGIDGKPHLSYQYARDTLNFTGGEIERVETALGAVVSVRIRTTVDSGSTTFSIFIPRVNVIAGRAAVIATEGVTTVHRFSIVPIFNQGQLDTYSVTPLVGTGEQVFF